MRTSTILAQLSMTQMVLKKSWCDRCFVSFLFRTYQKQLDSSQEQKRSPKRKFFFPCDSPWMSGQISRRRPGPKTFSLSLGARESKAFCTDILDTKVQTSTLRRGSQKIVMQEESGLIFHSLNSAQIHRRSMLSDPLNRLNAILSLLHPLDRYRTPSAIGSAIGRPYLTLSCHPPTSRSSQPPRSKPLGGLNHAIVVLQCLKPL